MAMSSATHKPRPRILWVSPYSLHPMIHGGAVRIVNLLNRLAAHCDVYVLVLIGGTDDPDQRQALAPCCQRVFFHKVADDPPPGAAPSAKNLNRPAAVERFANPLLRDRVAAIVQAYAIDLVQLEYTELGLLHESLPGVAWVLTEHDITFRSQERRRTLGMTERYTHGTGRDVGRWQRYEIEVCHRMDQVHVMSEDDRDFLAKHLTDGATRLRVIPNGVDTDHYRALANRSPGRRLLFLGSFPHLPNLDALDFFLAEVWPLLRRCQPEIHLTIAGARPPERVRALDGRDGITVAGEVESVLPLYQEHDLLVAPIRAGSGTRLKILEALASGLPVVSTTLGAEGLRCTDGQHLLLADTPGAIASAIERLLDDDELHRRLACQGRQLVEADYGWEAIGQRLLEGYRELPPETVFPDTGHPETAHPETGHPETGHPTLSIVIPVRRADTALESCLNAIAGQEISQPFEVLLIDATGSDEVVGMLARQSGARRVTVDGDLDPGRGANLGCRHALGRMVVFLDQDALPQDPRWLARLTAPLLAEQAPAAVRGAVIEGFSGSPSNLWPPGGHRAARRFTEACGGFEFSLVNAAIRRDIWEEYPFRQGEMLADRRWQCQMAWSKLLILPIDAASVLHERGRGGLGERWREAWRTGAAWRGLGIDYGVADLLFDLSRAGWIFIRQPRARARGPLFAGAWPLGLFLGHLVARFRGPTPTNLTLSPTQNHR